MPQFRLQRMQAVGCQSAVGAAAVSDMGANLHYDARHRKGAIGAGSYGPAGARAICRVAGCALIRPVASYVQARTHSV